MATVTAKAPVVSKSESKRIRILKGENIVPTAQPMTAAKSQSPAAPLSTTDARRAAALFQQAGDPTRALIVMTLADGPRHVGALVEVVAAIGQSSTQTAVSHHLMLLRHGGIVESRRMGKTNVYRLTETGERLAKAVAGITG